jgi:hypothetical protein
MLCGGAVKSSDFSELLNDNSSEGAITMGCPVKAVLAKMGPGVGKSKKPSKLEASVPSRKPVVYNSSSASNANICLPSTPATSGGGTPVFCLHCSSRTWLASDA